MRAADKELLGSWASITADLIKFFRSKDKRIYTDLAIALEFMADAEEEPVGHTPPTPDPGNRCTHDGEHASSCLPI